MKKFNEIIKKGLIVSCQAIVNEPLHVRGFMGRMALAAQMGGAVGIRANTPNDIKDIKKVVSIPIIGIYKKDYEGYEVRITPTIKEAKAIIKAGCDVVAIDATKRPRPKKQNLGELIKVIHNEFNVPVMADISTYEEGMIAAELGADAVATTLAGYTSYTKNINLPDLKLVKKLSQKIIVPVIAEGGYWAPEQVAKSIKNGAYAIVIGGAITRPHLITERFVKVITSELK